MPADPGFREPGEAFPGPEDYIPRGTGNFSRLIPAQPLPEMTVPDVAHATPPLAIFGRMRNRS